MPEARRPGPSGPDRFSPTGGSFRSAARTSSDMRASCQPISSLTASGRSGAASPPWLWRRTTRHRAHGRPCAVSLRPARPLEPQRPPQDQRHVRRRHRRNGGGSVRPRQALHARRLGFGRSRHTGGYRPEPPPQRTGVHVRRNQPPMPPRSVVRLRSASAENPQRDSADSSALTALNWPRA
jgi:hypothetical protein